MRPTELAGFVRQKIGGSAFDAADEVEAGVRNAMAAMDRDNDEGLDDGDGLEKDLGIEKSSFRKKIGPHTHVRMLGIGTTPSGPPKLEHWRESCLAASLSWSKSSAK